MGHEELQRFLLAELHCAVRSRIYLVAEEAPPEVMKCPVNFDSASLGFPKWILRHLKILKLLV
jgi:hypothetical protein